MTVTPLKPPSSDAPATVDRLFDTAETPVGDFRFDAKTAGVFGDMVGRSVPYYAEMQRMVGELAGDFATPGSSLFDLGCSTGATFLSIDPSVNPDVRFIGVDNSAEMLDKARAKLTDSKVKRPFTLIEADLHNFNGVENASVVTLVLTLMFIRPLYRQRFLETIYRGLNPGGCLILIEKLTVTHSPLNRLFIDHYYGYKRRMGYSEMEISRKREALENVLIPYRQEENRETLHAAGFAVTEEFFRWYNFAGLIAIKQPDGIDR